MTDGARTAKRKFLVVVKAPPNRPPVVAPVADTRVTEDIPMAALAIATSDPDRDRVAVRITGLPANLSFNAASRTIGGTATVPGVYPVTATASDGILAGAATFRIEVVGVNDAPVLRNQSMSVPAGSDNGTVVGTLAGSDEEGAALTYGGGSDHFSVRADGTVRVVQRSVLVNGAAPFPVPISVSDGNRSTPARLTISVTRTDGGPVVDDQSRTVAENAVTGTKVGSTLVANDPDGDSIRWEITSGAMNRFEIDSETGQLVVEAPLDFEATPVYTLAVRATAGALSDTATVIVGVTGVDEAPVLEISELAVDEDEVVGYAVGTVSATDPESDAVSYAVSGGDGVFTIDAESGVITLASVLDFETTASYRLTVTATAGALSSTAAQNISVNDIAEGPEIPAVDGAGLSHVVGGW